MYFDREIGSGQIGGVENFFDIPDQSNDSKNHTEFSDFTESRNAVQDEFRNASDPDEVVLSANKMIDLIDSLSAIYQAGEIDEKSYNVVRARLESDLLSLSGSDDAHFDRLKQSAVQQMVEEGRLDTEVEELAESVSESEHTDVSDIQDLADEELKAVQEELPKDQFGIMTRLATTSARKLQLLGLVGVLSGVVINHEPEQPVPVFGPVVRFLDRIGIEQSGFKKMHGSEMDRYRLRPLLVERFLGADEFVNMHIIKLLHEQGADELSRDRFESVLRGYISEYSTRERNNRFTDLNENTIDLLIETFVNTYLDQELDSEDSLLTYQSFSGFLIRHIGVKRASELQEAILEKYSDENSFLKTVEADYRLLEKSLKKASHASDFFFNQETGLMRVIHDGELIDTVPTRGGYMEIPDDADLNQKGYDRSPDGNFEISSVVEGYTTERWGVAMLPFGVPLRENKSGEVQYEYQGKWYDATGDNATFIGKGGRRLRPNKNKNHARLILKRSKGEGWPKKKQFYTENGTLRDRWDLNPFGPVSLQLQGRGELVHSNPDAEVKNQFLTPSHGCVRVHERTARELPKWTRGSTSKKRGSRIHISSQKDARWQDAFGKSSISKKPRQVVSR